MFHSKNLPIMAYLLSPFALLLLIFPSEAIQYEYWKPSKPMSSNDYLNYN